MKHLFFCLLLGAAIAVAAHRISPPELGVLSYPDQTRINDMRNTWFRQTGKLPDDAELRSLIENALNQDLLFAEALRRNYHLDDLIVRQRLLRDAGFLKIDGTEQERIQATLNMGVHLSDAMIRRRMVQRMEALASGAVAEVDEAELRAAYAAQPARWITEPRLTFSQLFFSVDSRDNPAEDARQQLQNVQTQAFSAVKQVGDFFMHGQHYRNQPPSRLQRYFGQGFVNEINKALKTVEPGTWFGPVASAYGQHLIRLDAVQASGIKPFEAVQETLRYEAEQRVKQQQMTRWLEQYRKRYRVVSSGLPG